MSRSLSHTEQCSKLNTLAVDLGGLGVTCSPRDPKFAGSNPAEVNEFFQDVKNPEHNPPGRT
jgi:hypothetical protein